MVDLSPQEPEHMNAASPRFVFALWVALAYTLGTTVHLRAVNRHEAGRPDEGAFKKLLGDGRRLFAGQFVEMADVYFHSGFYPSIFDRGGKRTSKAVTGAVKEEDNQDHEHHEHDEHGNCVHDKQCSCGHEEQGDCPHEDEDEHVAEMTPPEAANWLEQFIRRFRITEHTHLAAGNEREILPWLKLAIELDPQAIETYTTAAYWLREIKKSEQAEQVLREGLRNNPANHELLFEMGRLYQEEHHDAERTRNIWRYAFKCWQAQGEETHELTIRDAARIASHLGELELEAGNPQQAIEWFQRAKPYSPRPEAIAQRIQDIRAVGSASPDLLLPATTH
jgi:tetratricopeptide (TPR) repeat protein